jgi:hypothetical protein
VSLRECPRVSDTVVFDRAIIFPGAPGHRPLQRVRQHRTHAVGRRPMPTFPPYLLLPSDPFFLLPDPPTSVIPSHRHGRFLRLLFNPPTTVGLIAIFHHPWPVSLSHCLAAPPCPCRHFRRSTSPGRPPSNPSFSGIGETPHH